MIADHDPTPTIILPTVPVLPGVPAPQPPAIDGRHVAVLGVEILDILRTQVIALIEHFLQCHDSRTRSIYFVNAHTLNLASSDATYRAVLNSADYVFGDGTGVRWAARLGGVHLRDNVNGTDLVPELLTATAGRGYRYFMLGAEAATIHRAADNAARLFDGWTLVGSHHGYLDRRGTEQVIHQINRTRPDLLLVGMGNPLQERWIHEHRERLHVPVCMGVGGLFRYWAGDVQRAAPWLRRFGAEWVGVLWQQPEKAARYLLGNPLFLARAIGNWWFDRNSRRLR